MTAAGAKRAISVGEKKAPRTAPVYRPTAATHEIAEAQQPPHTRHPTPDSRHTRDTRGQTSNN